MNILTLIVYFALSRAVTYAVFVEGDPALRKIESFNGVKTGSYIVKLKDGASRSSLLKRINLGAKATTHWTIFNGFSTELDTSSLDVLRASPDVESIVEDGIVYAMGKVTQTNAPWNLARISSSKPLTVPSPPTLNYSYTYDATAGSGSDVYVVDTGIAVQHVEFQGRARWGYTGSYTAVDGNGHGTHIGGIVGAKTFGVAKLVNLIAVKVLSDSGSGSTADIISGLNWVLTQAKASGRPSVVLLALGGSASTALDNAVVSLTAGGVHVVVAAGGSNVDVGNTSPARVPSVITVGAVTTGDVKASSSNYGPGVDIWAPGVSIISTWISSTSATNTLSGTSMAAAHVAGVIAYLLTLEGPVSPAEMSTKLQSYCLKGVLSGIPSGTNNCLVHIP